MLKYDNSIVKLFEKISNSTMEYMKYINYENSSKYVFINNNFKHNWFGSILGLSGNIFILKGMKWLKPTVITNYCANR